VSNLRLAGPADAVALDMLATSARDELRAARGGRALLADPFLRGALEEDAGALRATWVSLRDDQPVAAALGWVEGTRGSFALYVPPEVRREGRGLSLAEAVIGWLRANGALDVDAPSLPGDRAMKQLLERLGFKARLLVMREGG
jgi:GNAT superfamily N-acetyltransferase